MVRGKSPTRNSSWSSHAALCLMAQRQHRKREDKDNDNENSNLETFDLWDINHSSASNASNWYWVSQLCLWIDIDSVPLSVPFEILRIYLHSREVSFVRESAWDSTINGEETDIIYNIWHLKSCKFFLKKTLKLSKRLNDCDLRQLSPHFAFFRRVHRRTNGAFPILQRVNCM